MVVDDYYIKNETITNDKKIDRKMNDIANKENSILKYNLNGIDFEILVSGKKSGKYYTIIEALFPANTEKGISLHKHTREDVVIHVIEGSFVFRRGKEIINGDQGMIIKFERNIPHSYKKIGKDGKQGRLLILYTPAGFENFFGEIGSSYIYGNTESTDYDPVVLQLLEKRYGWRIIFDEK